MATHSSVLAWRIPGTWGPWWAAVYGAAQSRTQLKQLSSSSCISHAFLSPPEINSLEQKFFPWPGKISLFTQREIPHKLWSGMLLLMQHGIENRISRLNSKLKEIDTTLCMESGTWVGKRRNEELGPGCRKKWRIIQFTKSAQFVLNFSCRDRDAECWLDEEINMGRHTPLCYMRVQ